LAGRHRHKVTRKHETVHGKGIFNTHDTQLILCYNTGMQNIVVIGAGFAGARVVRTLARYRREVSVTLIDKSVRTYFLPLIPDIVGRQVPAQHLGEDIAGLCKRAHAKFCNEEVVGIDFDARVVFTSRGKYPYDYLVIASGSQTNFYGDAASQSRAFPLDDAEDASRLAQAVGGGDFDAVVVVGAGYTGVEIAANLALYFKKYNRKHRVFLVERQPSILGPLPEWMKSYCVKNLHQMGVEIFTGAGIERMNDQGIVISGNTIIAHPLLVWAAGVRTADFIQQCKAEKNPQGRLKVDRYLRIQERVFCAGDASLFAHGDSTLRMAVQFAIFEGSVAAGNIIRSIRNKPLREYTPVDLGYIIPMANNKGCGVVGGVSVKGFLAVVLHYCMCIFRLGGLRNKWGVFLALMTPQQKGR